MKNQKALQIIKETEFCYVVWSLDSNEVIKVIPLSKNSTIEERILALAADSESGSHIMGRFIDPASITLADLEAEQAETRKIDKRRTIFLSWAHQPVDSLVKTLICQEFREPMDSFHGSDYIIEILYDFHSEQLTATHIDALAEFARSPAADQFMMSVRQKLECYLTAIRGDALAFMEVWRHHHEHIVISVWEDMMKAAGDLRISDPEIIAELISAISRGVFFNPKVVAMTALGKIGQPAGEAAALAIEQNIYDSSEYLKEFRHRVIDRIRSRDDTWVKCPKCLRGVVNPEESHSCLTCLGLALVRKSG